MDAAYGRCHRCPEYARSTSRREPVAVDLDLEVAAMLRKQAAEAHVNEGLIIDRAVRAYDLRALLARLQADSDLDDDQAMRLAREEFEDRAHRPSRRRLINNVADANVGLGCVRWVDATLLGDQLAVCAPVGHDAHHPLEALRDYAKQHGARIIASGETPAKRPINRSRPLPRCFSTRARRSGPGSTPSGRTGSAQRP